ncbi:maleylacetoacetate isomerase [Paraburkholderia hospita]|jgi:maleylacetoacetate isomerase|uniref:Maleylacetoacetate isomerase n=1 Tax=Paraburkholderia hospita TaxID=169430 RepID=A0AAN1MR25_9BURK|nr:maleylacetoacetate isomerase [Paraburkholderia hospita]AUT76239.1 maleylacetoacetate isomerase [Paraburkholderia hospita]SEI17645.1 maleylacetoacetate isomerase [Paraburkholderia hospita]
MKLYSYFRSSASYRVRIALALKGLPYEYAAVHLLKGGGQQLASVYRELNPDGLVPTLEDGPQVLTQSLAIIEYLDELYPHPPLLPSAPADRAFVRSVALQVACEIHPVNNLRVIQYLKKRLSISDAQKSEWYQHWIDAGFSSLESRLRSERRVGDFVFGSAPTIADLCLVPQVWNARRFEIPLNRYPTISRLAANAMALDAFAQAEPSKQPDAES